LRGRRGIDPRRPPARRLRLLFLQRLPPPRLAHLPEPLRPYAHADVPLPPVGLPHGWLAPLRPPHARRLRQEPIRPPPRPHPRGRGADFHLPRRPAARLRHLRRGPRPAPPSAPP